MTNTTGQLAPDEKCPSCGSIKGPSSSLPKEKPSWRFGKFERFCMYVAQFGMLLAAIFLVVAGVMRLFGGEFFQGVFFIFLYAPIAYGISLAVSVAIEHVSDEH